MKFLRGPDDTAKSKSSHSFTQGVGHRHAISVAAMVMTSAWSMKA